MIKIRLKKPNTVGAVLGLISPDKGTVLREAEIYFDHDASLHKYSVVLGDRCQVVPSRMRNRQHGTETCPSSLLSSVSLWKMGGRLFPFP